MTGRRKPWRPTLVAAAAAVALLVPSVVKADPISLIAIGANLGFTGTAALVAGAISAYGGYALIGLNIYGAVDARRRARAAQREATRRYNASLTDRNVTVLRSTPPWRIVYGECITGGDVLAIFTSDKPTLKNGAAGVKPDGLKHLVITLASHQVEAIGDAFIDGVPLGALDGAGYATGSDWVVPATPNIATVTFSGTTTLPVAATSIISAVTQGDQYNTFNVDRTVAISGGGLTLTVTDGLGSDPVTVAYTVAGLAPAVIRISKHLGTDTQTVDAYLNSIKPTEWDSSHRLRGRAYVVVTLDLEDPRFQGGPPNITFRVKGRRLYDPRLDSTNGGSGSHRANDPTTWAWSDNPALCVRDWIVGEYGMAAASADVVDAYTIAAANACDVTYSVSIGGAAPVNLPLYRCNGVATTEDSREKVLDDLADSMAGVATYGAQWQMMAGAWTAPVMDLTDDDLDGQIEIIQAGAGIDELVNGIRGTFIAADSASPGEFQPYQNATLLAADGADYWQDVALPFTNSQAHCKQIARVLVERGRNSLIISYPAKLPAWPLQVGDRVRVTNPEYGYTTKTFRVTDWQFGQRSPVTLLLQEDAADAYDTIDAVDADPTPNTDLPSPWLVETISLNTPQSGTNHLIRANDGTITPRVWVSWAELTGAFMRDGQGKVVVCWRRLGPDADWQQIEADAAAAGVYLIGVQDGDRVVLEAWAVNSGGWRGASDKRVHTVVGKTDLPVNVAGFAGQVVGGRVKWAWTAINEVDYAHTEVRSSNANWGSVSVPPLWRGTANQWDEAVTTVGGLTRYARHFDTSGNTSAAAVSASVTVADENLVESIAALAAAAYNGETQFVAGRAWNFSGSADGWTAAGTGAISAGSSSITVTSTAGDPQIKSPAGLNIYGPGFFRVRARVKRTAGTAWDGTCYYSTVPALPGYAGHSRSASYLKQIPDTTVTGQWVTLEWDMSNLDAGGNDWVVRTIDTIWLDLGADNGDVFEVDWIAVGTLAPGSYGAQFGVNILGTAETTDLTVNAATKVHTASASGVSVTGEKGVPTGTFTTLVSYTFTPPYDCEVLISAEGTGSISTAASGLLGDYAMLSTRLTVNGTQQGALRNYAIDQQIGFSQQASCGFARVQRFSATGGVSYTVVLQGQQYVVATTCTVDATLRIEEVRR